MTRLPIINGKNVLSPELIKKEKAGHVGMGLQSQLWGDRQAENGARCPASLGPSERGLLSENQLGSACGITSSFLCTRISAHTLYAHRYLQVCPHIHST